MLKEADNPLLGNLREERPDISVEYEVHLLAADPDDERIQRIVLTAFWSEPIREPEEVFLVDRAQHRSRGSLDDFVFEGRNRERTLAAVFLRHVAPAGRQRPVRSAFDLRAAVAGSEGILTASVNRCLRFRARQRTLSTGEPQEVAIQLARETYPGTC